MRLLILLVCLGIPGVANPALAAAPTTLGEFVTRFKALANPLPVRAADMFKDGGTLFLGLGDDLDLYLDGRMSAAEPGLLYINRHPGHSGTIKVPRGSEQETLILARIRAYVDSKPADAQALRIAKWIVEKVEAHAKETRGVTVTRESAIETAKRSFPLPDTGERIETVETEDTFVVKFVGIRFTDNDGTKKKSTMNITISKATGKMLTAAASDVQDVPPDAGAK
jgi:hypothetical protein